MFKKFTALLITFCIVICMSACDLEPTNSMNENSSSITETSTESFTNDDIFYDDNEADTSSEVVSEKSNVETTTTSKAPVSSKESSSSKISTSSKTSTSSKKVTTSKVTDTDDNQTEDMVWIPTNGGKKYHTNSGCSNMKNPEQVSIKTAKVQGFTPCKRCY